MSLNNAHEVQNLKTNIQYYVAPPNDTNKEFRKDLKSSSKKVQVGLITTVQIPPSLRVK